MAERFAPLSKLQLDYYSACLRERASAKTSATSEEEVILIYWQKEKKS